MLTTVALILGYTCNARCRHCLWGDTLNDKSRMSFDDACHFIDGIHELGTVKAVTFSGGEPFLFRDVMKSAMSYAYSRHRLASSVATNSYWATSRKQADEILGDLYARGLRFFYASIDDFHEEFVALERVANAVRSARDLNIHCTVGVATTGKSKRCDYYVDALKIEPSDGVEFVELHVAPVGYAATRIDPADYTVRERVPSDYCSALQLMNILPDGSVQVCCGGPLHSKELNIGNARTDRLADIVARAEWNPVFNALSLSTGPAILAKELVQLGKGADLRTNYVSSCDACQHILSGLKLGPELQSALRDRQAELYFQRLLTDEQRARG